MAYADDIRASDTVTLDTIADLIEGICSATGPLAWTQYNPTWGVEGGGSYSTSPAATDSCWYAIIGDMTLIRVFGTGTTTGTVTSITVTLPTTPIGAIGGGGGLYDNGSLYGSVIYSSTDTLYCKKWDRTALTGGAVTGISAFAFYINA